MPPKLRVVDEFRLGEGLKQAAHLLVGHADAAVGDFEFDPRSAIARFVRKTQRNGAVLGKFRGIAEQIDDALLELGEIGLQRADILRTVDRQCIAVLFHHRLDDRLNLVDQPREKDVL